MPDLSTHERVDAAICKLQNWPIYTLFDTSYHIFIQLDGVTINQDLVLILQSNSKRQFLSLISSFLSMPIPVIHRP